MMTFNKALLNQLFRFGIALTGNPNDAEDILQIAIERYLQKNTANIENKEAYLRKIMRNYWYDECRKQKVRNDYINHQNELLNDNEDNLIYLSQSTDDLLNIIISEDEVATLWQFLDDEQREILYLYAVLEYNTQEIMEELELPKGTVLARIHRLKKRLQKLLSENTAQGGMQ